MGDHLFEGRGLTVDVCTASGTVHAVRGVNRHPGRGAPLTILVLSIIMYAQSLLHVLELLTGLIGAVLLGLALRSSILHNRAEAR